MLSLLETNLHEIISEIIEPTVPVVADREKTFFKNTNVTTPKIPKIPGVDDFYAALEIISGPQSFGPPSTKITGIDPDEELEHSQLKQLTLSVQIFGFQNLAKAEEVEAKLLTVIFTANLRTKNLAVLDMLNIIPTPVRLDELWTKASTLDIVFTTTRKETEAADIIETAEDPTIVVN